MSTIPTTNYAWLIPVVGTEVDTWGPIVNTVFEDIDAEVFEKADIAGQTFTGQVVTTSGTAAAPGIGIGEADSGFYSIGADNVGMALGGVQTIAYSSDQVMLWNLGSNMSLMVRGDNSNATIIVRGDNSNAFVRTERYQTTGGGAGFTGRKARGTFALPTSVANTDTIALFTASAHDGTSFADWGSLALTVFETTPGIAAHGSKLQVSLCPPGSITQTDALSFEFTNGFRVRGSTVIDAERAFQLRSYTVASLPSATPAGRMIYVSNETGGAVPAFSDGVAWRRVTDRSVVA